MTVSEKSRWLILIVLSSALFLIVIDMTVLYTSLPSLARDLGTSASEKLWIINAYALVVAGLLPGLGTLGDRVGRRCSRQLEYHATRCRHIAAAVSDHAAARLRAYIHKPRAVAADRWASPRASASIRRALRPPLRGRTCTTIR
jgi:predicted MFS family arabinose efflux permease